MSLEIEGSKRILKPGCITTQATLRCGKQEEKYSMQGSNRLFQVFKQGKARTLTIQ